MAHVRIDSLSVHYDTMRMENNGFDTRHVSTINNILYFNLRMGSTAHVSIVFGIVFNKTVHVYHPIHRRNILRFHSFFRLTRINDLIFWQFKNI